MVFEDFLFKKFKNYFLFLHFLTKDGIISIDLVSLTFLLSGLFLVFDNMSFVFQLLQMYHVLLNIKDFFGSL